VTAVSDPETPRPDSDDPEEALTHWEGEPVRVWESVWEVPRFEAWSRLGSTNDRLRRLALAGAAPFSVVIAEEQTMGRGRTGRRWDSPPGLGLWMSVLLRPAATEAARLTPLIVGLAVCRAFEHVARELSASLKWPNDVLLGDRKAAGVLCEAAGAQGVVAGVGINVCQRLSDFPEPLRGRAVSLEMAAGRAVSRSTLAGALVAEMRALLSRPPLRLEGAVAREVERRDALRGLEIRVEDDVQGTARGVDANGRLQVEVASGRRHAVVAGSVTILSGRGASVRSPRS
jgi:BirA family biotin operon repressor/biotin-[acetyl-CoA-carboxylase] ligase